MYLLNYYVLNENPFFISPFYYYSLLNISIIDGLRILRERENNSAWKNIYLRYTDVCRDLSMCVALCLHS